MCRVLLCIHPRASLSRILPFFRLFLDCSPFFQLFFLFRVAQLFSLHIPTLPLLATLCMAAPYLITSYTIVFHFLGVQAFTFHTCLCPLPLWFPLRYSSLHTYPLSQYSSLSLHKRSLCPVISSPFISMPPCLTSPYLFTYKHFDIASNFQVQGSTSTFFLSSLSVVGWKHSLFCI